MISVERINAQMEALGLNPFSTAKQAGLGASYVRDILRGRVKEPSAYRLGELAKVLKCSPEYLQGIGGEVGEPPTEYSQSKLVRLHVDGVVREGFFHKYSRPRFKREDKFYTVASYAFEALEYLVSVEDDQVNGRVPAGSFAHVVPVDKYYAGLTDLVLLEQYKDGGDLVGTSIRSIHFDPHGIVLRPSLDWIKGATPLTWETLTSGQNDYSVKAFGVVIRCYLFFDDGVGEDELPF